MLPLLFAAALAASPPPACKFDLAPGETLIERRSLPTRNGELEAVSLSEPDTETDPPSSRAMVLSRDCKVVFEQRFDATQARFSEGRLGEQPFLFVTAFRPGGSGCAYEHLILAYGGENYAEDGVQPLAPMPLGHGNMDGVFVGDLGRGRGPGLVTWTAQWDDGHYSPHQYQIVTYSWREGRFVGPKIWFTKHRHVPSPDKVAKSLDFSFGDMTHQERFGEC
jgi:hypothetical protein